MRLVSLQGKLFNIMMPALYALFQKPERVEISLPINNLHNYLFILPAKNTKRCKYLKHEPS